MVLLLRNECQIRWIFIKDQKENISNRYFIKLIYHELKKMDVYQIVVLN